MADGKLTHHVKVAVLGFRGRKRKEKTKQKHTHEKEEEKEEEEEEEADKMGDKFVLKC